MSEILDRMPLSNQDLAEWRRRNEWRLRWNEDLREPKTKGVASGRLQITLPAQWDGSRHNWTEGPRCPLETKLGDVLEELERRPTKRKRVNASGLAPKREHRQRVEIRRERNKCAHPAEAEPSA